MSSAGDPPKEENAMETRVVLPEAEIPTHWHKVVADFDMAAYDRYFAGDSSTTSIRTIAASLERSPVVG
jgi:hypothetical protein